MFDEDNPEYEDARREAIHNRQVRRAQLLYPPGDPDYPYWEEGENDEGSNEEE